MAYGKIKAEALIYNNTGNDVELAISDIVTSSGSLSAYALLAGATFTGDVNFDGGAIIKGDATNGSGELTLNCENNSHGIKIKGPPHSAAATYTLTLPNNTGTNGQVLTTNGSGVSSWSTIDLASKLSLTGGTLTGGLTGTTANFSGNVGVGTSSPGSNLDIEEAGASANAELAINYTGSGSGRTSAIRFQRGGSNFGYICGATFALTSGNNDDLAIAPTSGKNLLFGIGNSEKARIDSSGRLLMGTSSAVLDTSNALVQLAASAGANMVLYRDDSSVSNADSLGLIRFYSNAGSSKQEHGRITCIADGASGANDKPGALLFYTTADGASSPTERLKIDSSGTVIVGTSTTVNPTLRILGTSAHNSFLQFADGDSNNVCQLQYNHPANALITAVNGNERLRIDSSGRLLIGTTTAGSGQLTVASTSHTGITIRSGNTSTNSNLIFADAASGADVGVIQYSHSTDSLRFTVNNAERMRIDSSGRLLLNTSSSRGTHGGGEAQFQIEGTNTATAGVSVTRTDNGSGSATFSFGKTRNGSAVQNGDNLGTFYWQADDGTDLATAACSISGAVDGTPGANDMPGRLVFSTTTDGASSPTERMRITSSSGTQIRIVGSTSADSGAIQFVNSSQAIQWNLATNASNLYIADADFSNYAYLSQNPTAWQFASDARLKENIKPLDYGIDTVKQIKPCSFNFIGNDIPQIGFIAQDLKTVVPEAVSGEEIDYGNDDTPEERAKKSMGLSKETLVPVLVKALHETITKIETLEQRLSDAGIA